jgi:hypothetical protein
MTGELSSGLSVVVPVYNKLALMDRVHRLAAYSVLMLMFGRGDLRRR